MKILLFGPSGQVGFELIRTLAVLGQVITHSRAEVDLAHPEEIRNSVRDVAPDVIVNAAAYTAVDKAETETRQCEAINAVAPGILAEEAKSAGALFVHYSTDYVFPGDKREAYTEEDSPSPLNEYGRSKLEGERHIARTGARHLIFRTSWVYGTRGNNFFRTMLRLASQRSELSVVSDQVGSPTWSRMIAEATALCVSKALSDRSIPSGIYNMTAAGSTSWFGFANAIFDGALAPQLKPQVVPIETAQYPTAARRPSYSVLANQKLANIFFVQLPPWMSQLEMAIEELKRSEGSQRPAPSI